MDYRFIQVASLFFLVNLLTVEVKAAGYYKAAKKPRPIVHGISETFHKQDSKGNYQYGYHIKTHFGSKSSSPQSTHVYDSKKAREPPSVVIVNDHPDYDVEAEPVDGDLQAVSSYKGPIGGAVPEKAVEDDYVEEDDGYHDDHPYDHYEEPRASTQDDGHRTDKEYVRVREIIPDRPHYRHERPRRPPRQRYVEPYRHLTIPYLYISHGDAHRTSSRDRSYFYVRQDPYPYHFGPLYYHRPSDYHRNTRVHDYSPETKPEFREAHRTMPQRPAREEYAPQNVPKSAYPARYAPQSRTVAHEAAQEEIESTLVESRGRDSISFPVGQARGPVVRKVVKVRGPLKSQPLVYDVQPIEVNPDDLPLREHAPPERKGYAQPHLIEIPERQDQEEYFEAEEYENPARVVRLRPRDSRETPPTTLSSKPSVRKVMKVVRRKDRETGKMETVRRIPVYTSVTSYDKETDSYIPIAYVHNPRAKAVLRSSAEHHYTM